MTKFLVTDDWDKWAEEAGHLAYKFQYAVEYNQRDDEFATAWDMMEFLQETVAAGIDQWITWRRSKRVKPSRSPW